MGWAIALAVLVLLGCLPVGISAIYADSGPLVRLIAGPIRIQLFPSKKKEKSAETEEPTRKNESEKKQGDTQKPEQKQGGSWKDFLPMVKVVTDFLGDFRRKLRVKRLELKLTMAGDDPCDLAVNYGRAWAAVGSLMPQLERFLVIKKRDIQVSCDFESSEAVVYIRGDITITVGRILGLGIRYSFRAIKEYFKIIDKRKGGAIK